jgi:hypothetical protein
VLKVIKPIVVAESFVLSSYFYSAAAFTNIQVAFASSLFIIVGSSLAYRGMVENQVSTESYEDKRDLLDEIEDPHELYDEVAINETPVEELDLKAIVKEERAKIKTFSLSSIKHGARGSVSLFRLLPYLFLVLGFIALKNNEVLDLSFYLPSLFIGIVVGSLVSKELVS